MSPSHILHTLKERTTALTKLIRYHQFPVMFYRTNLWNHSQRLKWMIEEITPFVHKVYPHFHTETAQIMAEVHDDLELVMGDIMLAEKLNYNKKQLAELSTKEQAAIDEIATQFPAMIGTYNYKELLLRYQNIDSSDIEAVVVKYCDKYDAFGESLHEIHAGNFSFTRGYEEKYISPPESYIHILQTFPHQYPVFSPLRETGHPLLAAPPALSPGQIASNGAPHTLASLHTPSAYIPYQTWKEIVLNYGGEQGTQWLLTKVE